MAEYVFKIDKEIKACYSDVYSQDGYCPFHFYAFNGGSHCSISDCKCTKTKRPEGCPLVELPPHGRLIDVDRFMDDNADGFEMNWNNEKGETIGRIFAPFAPVKKALDKAPTVIEASTKERE